MEIKTFVCGYINNNVYIIYDESKECAIVDAPFNCAELLTRFIRQNNLTPIYILLTHGHFDHTGGLAELKKQTNAKIVIHKNDAYRLEKTEEMGIKLEPVDADILLKGNEILQFGKTKINVLFTPGHTEGGVSYVLAEEKVVFVGDTLFYGSIGRTDFAGGDFNTLITSIKENLLVLPDDFCVYPGHGETTTIKYEKLYNPYINM